jgi:hypothetical protein
MTKHKLQKIIFILLLAGFVIHFKEVFWEISESAKPTITSLLLELAWGTLPYLVIFALRNKTFYGALFAATVVFCFDLMMHLEVFYFPSSSTAALGLLFMPFWNLVLFTPLSFLAGNFIETRLKKKNKDI